MYKNDVQLLYRTSSVFLQFTTICELGRISGPCTWNRCHRSADPAEFGWQKGQPIPEEDHADPEEYYRQRSVLASFRFCLRRHRLEREREREKEEREREREIEREKAKGAD